MDEDHEALAELKKRIGGTRAGEITDDMLASEWIYLSPLERANELVTLEKWIDHSGKPDRKTARLLDFDRKVREIDRDLRKAGR